MSNVKFSSPEEMIVLTDYVLWRVTAAPGGAQGSPGQQAHQQLREGLTSHSYPSRASLWTEVSTGSTLPSYNTQSHLTRNEPQGRGYR